MADNFLQKTILVSFLLLAPPSVCLGQAPVVINEVAWMGTQESHYDEWIELKNNTEKTVDLSGWSLTAEDGSPDARLTGKIGPRAFFILERTDDTSLPDLKADIIYTGSLNNKGETLKLVNSRGRTVDLVQAGEGWPAGNNQDKRTMERKEEGWHSSREPGGTPGAENSPGLEIKKVEKTDRPRLLEAEAYTKAANTRFLQTLYLGSGSALLCSTAAVIIKRRITSTG